MVHQSRCTCYDVTFYRLVTVSRVKVARFALQNTAVLSAAILVTLVGMMLHIHYIKIDHETLLIVGSLGIQVSASYASGRESTSFIEMSRIKDIVINEAIYMVRSEEKYSITNDK